MKSYIGLMGFRLVGKIGDIRKELHLWLEESQSLQK